MLHALYKEVRIPLCIVLPALLACAALFSIYALNPTPIDRYNTGSDGSYWQSMDYLDTGQHMPSFLPNRFVTGSGFILTVVELERVFGSREVSWLLLNSVFYVGMGLCFYALAAAVLKDARAAFFSTLLIAFNYAAVVYGPYYAADASGWFFYIATLYCSFRFYASGEHKWLWAAAALVGIGGVFKEYALCGGIAVACSIVFAQRGQWFKKLALLFGAGAVCAGPFLLANLWTWHVFQYTYLNWWAYNQTQQSTFPDSRLDEYIKVLGGIYNVAWFLFLPGLYLLWQRRRNIMSDVSLSFILIVALSSLPVLVWPPFQRVFFITAPTFVLVAGLFFARVRRYWLLVPWFAAYVLCAYLMDSYILKAVNIGPLLHVLLAGH